MFRLGEAYKESRHRFHLIPFFKCVVFYFFLYEGGVQEWGFQLFLAVSMKCAPVLWLITYVWMIQSKSDITPEARTYCSWMATGLAMSAAGDAALETEGGVPWGMVFFGLAHIAYAGAFGFQPTRPRLAVALYAAGALYCSLLRSPPDLENLVRLYIVMLMTMTWRALSRAAPLTPSGTSPRAAPRGAWTAAAAAVAFIFSDAILSYSMFNGPVRYKQTLVMLSYYAAQLGLAVSAEQLSGDKPVAL